jgi:hypothetical protein
MTRWRTVDEVEAKRLSALAREVKACDLPQPGVLRRLLVPGTPATAIRSGLPVHRGPAHPLAHQSSTT